MNITNVTLRDLEYVVAVGELGHFGRAAQRCHVSQPALSGQIRKIEDFFGVRLFERTNRRVSITAVGQEVIDQARVVLDESRKLVEIVGGGRDPLTGPFRLGAIATLGPYYVPHLLGPLKKVYPKLELHLAEGLTSELLEKLKIGELDAILASPTFDEDGYKIQPLFFEPFVLLTPRRHELARKAALRTTDLKAGEMVLLEDGHCLKDQTLGLCQPNRRGNIRQFHATSLETLKALVATGHGYTLIPALAARPDERLKDLLEYRKFDGKSVGRAVTLVCRTRFGKMVDCDELARFIRRHPPPGTNAL